MAWVSMPLPATAQYPFRELPLRYATHCGIPSFIRFLTLALGFFHCFQIYIRILRRSQPSHSCMVVFMLAIPK